MRKALKTKVDIYCAENQITKEQLCKEVGISYCTLNVWFSQKEATNIDKVLSLMEKLSLTVEDFKITNSNNMEQTTMQETIDFLKKYTGEDYTEQRVKNLEYLGLRDIPNVDINLLKKSLPNTEI